MESVLRALAVYLLLLAVIRLTGRRTLGETTPFDLVLILIVAETSQQALLGEDNSLVNAAIVMLTLFMTDIGLSYLKDRFTGLAKVIDGTPTVLIAHGKPLDAVMRKARVDLDDVLQAARKQHGLERLDQIEFAVLETGSGISVIPKRER